MSQDEFAHRLDGVLSRPSAEFFVRTASAAGMTPGQALRDAVDAWLWSTVLTRGVNPEEVTRP